jgi:hypothetical protein
MFLRWLQPLLLLRYRKGADNLSWKKLVFS